jgi:hypothetical protein
MNSEGKIEKISYENKNNDKDFFQDLWKRKYNVIFKEKKQNILDYALGKTKSV